MEYALQHAKPRALDAASRAEQATRNVPDRARTLSPMRPRRLEAKDVVPRCPFCSAGACDVKRGEKVLRECCWCTAVSERTATGWLLVGECRSFDGR